LVDHTLTMYISLTFYNSSVLTFLVTAPTRVLVSFPTRRSSDLELDGEANEPPQVGLPGQLALAEPVGWRCQPARFDRQARRARRSEEHTSELQSHLNLVCRILHEKKKGDVPVSYGVLDLTLLQD